ncbi:MAG TPA: PepSY-like domain-containing protein [Ignavibacteriales bacterium]|nr:PepSY-like domain-containing protein [Ignavibacteriales bacterium]
MKNIGYISKVALTAAVLTLTISFSSNAQSKKKDVKKNVPQAVLDSFKKAYPNAVIKGSGKEVEEGKTFYEIESVDGKVKRDLLYLPDGKVAEIEEKISNNDLPATVISTVKKESPKGKITSAEKVTKNGTENFELMVKDAASSMELVLDKNGKVIAKEIKGSRHKKESKEEKESGEENE